MATLAARALIHGPTHAFTDLPCGVFGKLITVDRAEIESYRSVRNLMLEYVRLHRPERPLCLAVFGQPGTGRQKMLAVVQHQQQLAPAQVTDQLVNKQAPRIFAHAQDRRHALGHQVWIG